MAEIWDVYDINENKLNKKVERDDGMLQEGEYHLSVDVWIVNSRKQFLIQKRSPSKRLFPDMWECSAGGAVVSGETSYQACIREVYEELGIEIDMKNAKMVHKFVRNKNALMNVWLVQQNINLEDIKLQEEEVADVKYASVEDIKLMINDNVYVPVVVDGLKACLKCLGIDY